MCLHTEALGVAGVGVCRYCEGTLTAPTTVYGAGLVPRPSLYTLIATLTLARSLNPTALLPTTTPTRHTSSTDASGGDTGSLRWSGCEDHFSHCVWTAVQHNYCDTVVHSQQRQQALELLASCRCCPFVPCFLHNHNPHVGLRVCRQQLVVCVFSEGMVHYDGHDESASAPALPAEATPPSCDEQPPARPTYLARPYGFQHCIPSLSRLHTLPLATGTSSTTPTGTSSTTPTVGRLCPIVHSEHRVMGYGAAVGAFRGHRQHTQWALQTLVLSLLDEPPAETGTGGRGWLYCAPLRTFEQHHSPNQTTFVRARRGAQDCTHYLAPPVGVGGQPTRATVGSFSYFFFCVRP